ncbi:hypothetical protein HK105_206670 [Polyrhizophydium stewartii]|uniref:Uncharacterized protein n=1 Tax=Polyrhizophydium stewartii TaxID=2732419 RepID=A0ABR4N2L9_9FUNG
MSSPIDLRAVSLPSELIATTLTVVGIAASPVFGLWIAYRLATRPSSTLSGLSVCTLMLFATLVLRLIAANGPPYVVGHIMRVISTHLFYFASLAYVLIQISVLRLFLPHERRVWAPRLQAFVVALFVACSPPALLDGIVFSSLYPSGIWSTWYRFTLVYLVVVIFLDAIQSIIGISYLVRVVIQMFHRQLRHRADLSEAVRQGMRSRQQSLILLIVLFFTIDLVAVALNLLPVPENTPLDISQRLTMSYRQIGFALGLFHAMTGTFILESMRDFRKTAESFHLSALNHLDSETAKSAASHLEAPSGHAAASYTSEGVAEYSLAVQTVGVPQTWENSHLSQRTYATKQSALFNQST